MSLNKFMHPRNRYKNTKPSFLHLALKYPDFRAHTTQDESGKVFLDFKNADALRALTTCLLKEDFSLSVELPADRLVPTLPLRLNYIHWLEDIIGSVEGKWGIDIGTGASCIYPLLAAKINKWHFLATEADPENAFHAKKNVTANGFEDVITVKQVSTEDVLMGPLESFTETNQFDFCMCNPPFFADHMEMQALTTTRSVDRPDAGSVSTASPQESIAQGGEVGFIRQMIEESTVLRDKVRVYTSMVGKKSSLAALKDELRHQKVAKFSTTEFCQGKTMRWGIAWTYDDSVTFPKSQFESRKEKPPLQYMIPPGAGGVEYKVHELATYLRELLESIKVHCYQGKKAKNYTSVTLTAAENTWCHQRRQRRQQQRQQQQQRDGSQNTQAHEDSLSEKVSSVSKSEQKSDSTVSLSVQQDTSVSGVTSSDNLCSKRPLEDAIDESGDSVKRQKVENTNGGSLKAANKVSVNGDDISENVSSPKSIVQAGQNANACQSSSSGTSNASEIVNDSIEAASADDSFTEADTSDMSPKDYILKCVMRLKRVDEQVQLELEWLDGQNRELLHQVMTFFKNKLTQGKK